MDFQFFEVGGCVRDSFLGIPSKDVDFSVVAPEGQFATAAEAFEALEASLREQGFQVFESRQDFLTIRARVPASHALAARTTVADFVLARRDGPYSDGRRPDFVLPGTLMDDLSRRDFTSGAICRSIGGEIIDPFGGVSDVKNKVLRFVGDPEQRIKEDGLRILRGLRFQITKGFLPTVETKEALISPIAFDSLSRVSKERIREELNKMLSFSTPETLRIISDIPPNFIDLIFCSGLRLEATLKSAKRFG